MSQTISLPKTVFEEIIERLNRLEAVVFGKKKEQFPDEYVVLSERAKKRYKKMEEDFKRGKNIHHAKDVNELLQQLNT